MLNIPTLQDIKDIIELTDKQTEERMIENVQDDMEENRIDFD